VISIRRDANESSLRRELRKGKREKAHLLEAPEGLKLKEKGKKSERVSWQQRRRATKTHSLLVILWVPTRLLLFLLLFLLFLILLRSLRL